MRNKVRDCSDKSILPLSLSLYSFPMSFFSSSGRRSDGGGGSTWMSGLISGAGKVISSVFGSDSPSPSSSSYSYSSDEEESTDMSSKECDEQKQIEEKLETSKDYNGRSLAIISEVNSKNAIEQLIMQETFSREEVNHLTKVIQSRVLGEDGSQKELLDRPSGNSFSGAWKSFNQSREAPETNSFSPRSLDAISPRFSGYRVLTPDLRRSTVMEVKKWLADKRLATTNNVDYHHTPCTLNTDIYDIDGEVGSPIDMARSYMQSMSTWKSLPFCSNGIEKTPHTATDLYKDRLPHATANHSLCPSKGLKRSHLDLGSQVTFHEIRNVRPKGTENVSDNSKFKLTDLSTTYLEREACQSSAADKCIYHDSRNISVLDSLDASGSFSAKLHAKDNRPVGSFTLPYETKVSNPARLGSVISVSLIPDAEEVVNAVQTTHTTSSLITLPLRPNSAMASGPPAIIILDENQDAEELSQVKEDSPIPPPAMVQNDGNGLESVSNSSSQLMVSVDIKPSSGNVEAATNIDEVNTSSRQETSLSQLVLNAKEVESTTDSEQCAKCQAEAEVNGSMTLAFGSTAGLNLDLHVASKEKPYQYNSSKNEQAVDVPRGSCGLLIESNNDAPPLKKTKSSRGRLTGGTSKKSIEEVLLTETQSSTSRARGRKTVPRPRRGRKSEANKNTGEIFSEFV